MNQEGSPEPGYEFSEAAARSKLIDQLIRSRRLGWVVATVSAAVSILLLIVIVQLFPLHQMQRTTLTVDRQTGEVEVTSSDRVTMADGTADRSTQAAQENRR